MHLALPAEVANDVCNIRLCSLGCAMHTDEQGPLLHNRHHRAVTRARVSQRRVLVCIQIQMERCAILVRTAPCRAANARAMCLKFVVDLDHNVHLLLRGPAADRTDVRDPIQELRRVVVLQRLEKSDLAVYDL